MRNDLLTLEKHRKSKNLLKRNDRIVVEEESKQFFIKITAILSFFLVMNKGPNNVLT